MVRIEGNKTRDINQLHDEIIKEFAKTLNNAELNNLKTKMKVFGDDNDTHYLIDLPNIYNKNIVQNVIDRHTPKIETKRQLTKQQFLDELLIEFANNRGIDIV